MYLVELLLGTVVWRCKMFGFTKIDSVSTDELAQLLQQHKTQLIDVREPSEFRAGHIKGARNIPLGQIGQFSVAPDTKVYTICQSGLRSKNAYKIFLKKNMNVVNVSGGMNSWRGKVINGS